MAVRRFVDRAERGGRFDGWIEPLYASMTG
jgi:hypothetical protein